MQSGERLQPDTIFDWDTHNAKHILDEPGAKVLFILADEESMSAAMYGAIGAYAPAISVNELCIGLECLTFENGAEIAFTDLEGSIERLDECGYRYSRIIIEDMTRDMDSMQLREYLCFLDEGSQIRAKLYCTYSDDPCVFVLESMLHGGKIIGEGLRQLSQRGFPDA